MLSERLDEKQRSEILFNLYLFSFPFKTQFSFSRLKFNHKIRKDHCTIKTTCKIWDTPTTLSRSYLTPLLVRYKTHPFLFWKTSERSETISVSPTGRRRSSSLSHQNVMWFSIDRRVVSSIPRPCTKTTLRNV